MKMLRQTYFLLPESSNRLCWKGRRRLFHVMIEEPPGLIMVIVSQRKDQQPSQRRSLSSLFPLIAIIVLAEGTNYAPTQSWSSIISPDFNAPPKRGGNCDRACAWLSSCYLEALHWNGGNAGAAHQKRGLSPYKSMFRTPTLGMARSEWSEKGAYCLSGVEVTAANIQNQDGTSVELCYVSTSEREVEPLRSKSDRLLWEEGHGW